MEPNEGNHISFLSFPNNVAAANISNLGVTLGNCSKEILDSISSLRIIEQNRLSTKLSSKVVENEVSESELLDNDDDNDLENLTLCHLCGDLMEEVMDYDSDHLSCDFQAIYKKNKSRASFRKKKEAKIRIVNKCKNGLK